MRRLQTAKRWGNEARNDSDVETSKIEDDVGVRKDIRAFNLKNYCAKTRHASVSPAGSQKQQLLYFAVSGNIIAHAEWTSINFHEQQANARRLGSYRKTCARPAMQWTQSSPFYNGTLDFGTMGYHFQRLLTPFLTPSAP